MVTTNEEQRVETVEERTIGERMEAVEAQRELIIEVVRENGRPSDENYRALDAKFDAKMDRLMYFMLGIGGAVLVVIIVGIVLQLVL